MTLASDISTTSTALSDIKQAIIDKGVTPSGNITTYATAIAQISDGGSSGKYSLLERISDDSNNEIGTVSGFFTDANDVEYAVVCLDAQYRLEQAYYTMDAFTVPNLPLYLDWNLWSSKETATFNSEKILNYDSSPAVSHCRSKSFAIDGIIYYGQLPNIVELVDICKNYTAIQSADASVSQYSSLGFPRTDRCWSSTQASSSNAWVLRNDGVISTVKKDTRYFICPVLEIPNQ